MAFESTFIRAPHRESRNAPPYFDLNVDIIYDPIIQSFSPEIRWLWICCIAAANKSPVRGKLLISRVIPYEIPDLAKMADLSIEKTSIAITLFCSSGVNLLTKTNDVYALNLKPLALKRNEWRLKYKLLSPLVYARDGSICNHCQRIDNLSVDHILPLSRGGTNELDNLQILCRSCNSRKGARI